MSHDHPQLAIRMIFSSEFKIGSILNHKDEISSAFRSSAIYKFTFDFYKEVFVGSICGNFINTIGEHRGISNRTDMSLTRPAFSSIREHCITNGILVIPTYFEIVTQAIQHLDLRTLESLFTHTIVLFLKNDNVPFKLHFNQIFKILFQCQKNLYHVY